MNWPSRVGHWTLETIGWGLKLAGALLIALLVAVMSTLGSGWFVLMRADEQVNAYCRSVAAGTPIAGLPDRAKARGLEVVERSGQRDETGRLIGAGIVAHKGWGPAQMKCVIKHDGTVVTGTHVFMDMG